MSALPDGRGAVKEALARGARSRLAGRNAPLGLLLEPGEGLDDIAADLPRFALVALEFPKYSDGRAFSTARLLREKHRLHRRAARRRQRAERPDPLHAPLSASTRFEVTNAPTRRALTEGRIAEVSLYYQPDRHLRSPRRDADPG